ncbi:MAG: [NiFe]-hydrogenase assembly chaperone HybE [Gammaproteobacteria bacterium]|nr:[NiFe]-hydrogenase assembly chaperone HybE [Gammaproteobacteria bacterium]
MSNTIEQLVEHFEAIHSERMAGLPLCNPALEVEAVGFREFEGHQLGILVTPWFMNLVLLSETDAWRDWPQGSKSEWSLPAGPHEFTTSRDEDFPTHLTAVLFRTVQDFPDQDTARRIAAEILKRLFVKLEESPRPNISDKPVSRRELLSGLGRS